MTSRDRIPTPWRKVVETLRVWKPGNGRTYSDQRLECGHVVKRMEGVAIRRQCHKCWVSLVHAREHDVAEEARRSMQIQKALAGL